MTWIEFPLSGQQEGIDARLLPRGAFANVRNLQQPTLGRWEKRNGYTALDLKDENSGSAAPITENVTLSLAAIRDDRLILGSEPVQLYNWISSVARVAPYDPDANGETWAPATFAAPRRIVIESEGEDDAVADCAVSANTGFGVVVCVTAGELVAHAYAGDQRVSRVVLVTGVDAIRHVQCLDLFSYVLVSWVEEVSGTCTIKFSLLSAHSGVGFQDWSAPVTVGVALNEFVIPAFAARDNETPARLCVVYQAALSSLAVKQYAAPYTSTAINTTHTITSTITAHCATYVDVTSDTSWIVWVDDANDVVYGCCGTATYASLGSNVALDSADTPTGQPVICRRQGSVAVNVAWDVFDSGDSIWGIRSAYLSSTPGVFGTAKTYWHWRIVSRMRASPYGGREGYLVAAPFRGQTLPYSYYLLKIEPNTALTVLAPDNILHCKFAEDQGAYRAFSARPYLSTTGDDWVWAWRAAPADLGVSIVRWKFAYRGPTRGQPVEYGGGLYYTGGVPWRWDGARPWPAGYQERAEITSGGAGSSGSLTPSSVYSWRAVFRREELDGSVTVSAPSAPLEATLGAGENSFTIKIRPDATRGQPTTAVVYRTLANGSVWFLVATIPLGISWQDAAPYEYEDIASDTVIEENATLYTHTALENRPMPPCRVAFRAGNRLWAAGLEYGSRARCSKSLFLGETASFPAFDTFAIETPEPIVGGGSLDSMPVLFGERSITVVTGDGPDDTGVGQFATRAIPCDHGLVSWGQRSIIEAGPGLFYQTSQGIYLLPRGFGPPQYVGLPVRDTLVRYPYITSACVVGQELRFTAVDDADEPAAGVQLIYDLRSGVWIVSDTDTGNTPIAAASVWAGSHVIATPALDEFAVSVEDTAPEADGYLSSQFTTGDICPGGVLRFGRCRLVQLRVSVRESCDVTAELSTDEGGTWSTVTWSVANEGDPYFAEWPTVLQWHLPKQKATQFRLRVTDSSGSQKGVIYLGVALDLRGKAFGRRVHNAWRY